MNATTPPSLRHRLPLMAFAAMLLLPSSATALITEFIGPNDYDPNFGYAWSDSSYWDQGLPGPGDDVLVSERLDGSSDPYPHFGPLLVVNTTINSLTLGDHTSVNNAVIGPGKNLFVSDHTDMGNASSLTNFAGRFSLGTLYQYDAGTKTMDFGRLFYLGDREASGTGILEFRNADIQTNKSFFLIYGAHCFVRDQLTGLNAFRNLAINDGILWFNDGYRLTTGGNLTNNGAISLNINPLDSRTPELHISGNFVNNGTVKLYGRSVFTVAGGLSGTGTIEIVGLPVTCDVPGVWTLNGGVVNFGGSGLDGFTLKAIAFRAENNATVKGSGTIEAGVIITSGTIAPGNSAGTIGVKGNLTLEAGAKLQMEIAGKTHDKITQHTGAAGTVLGGALEVTTIGDFDDEVLHTSTYEILTSNLPLTGAFSNVASGARLNTADGKGSFRVDYGTGAAAPAKVMLSDYIAVNAPQTYAQWIAAQGVAAPDNDPLDDPNGDGIENLEAYFRGIAAAGDSQPRGLSTAASQGNLIVTIRSPRTVTGVTLGSKITNNFDNTQNGPVPVLVGTTPTRNIHEITVPASGPRGFASFTIGQD